MKNESQKNKSEERAPAAEIDIEQIVADMPAAYAAWEKSERDPALKRVEEKIEKILKDGASQPEPHEM